MTIESTKFMAFVILTGFLFSGCSLLSKPELIPSSMWNKPEILCDYPTSEKLVNNARIIGKIALVTKDFTREPSQCRPDGFFNDPSKKAVEVTTYFPEEIYATKPEEIDTLIKIETKKGNLINSFTADTAELQRVSVYSSFIEISVIDYKTSTVIAKEQNESTEFPKGVSSGSIPFTSVRQVKEKDGSVAFEYVIPESIEQHNKIKTYLAKYSDKVKPAQ